MTESETDAEREVKAAKQAQPVLKPRAEHGSKAPTIPVGTYQKAAASREYYQTQTQTQTQESKDKSVSIFDPSRAGETKAAFNMSANQNKAERPNLAERAAKLREASNAKSQKELAQMRNRDRRERERDYQRGR